MFRPRIQKGQILAGTLTQSFELGYGSEYPENIWVILTISAMSGSETLDITGLPVGETNYLDAVLCTQIDVKAAESTTIKQTLPVSTIGPMQTILLTATNIAAAETIDITVISW